MMIKTGLEMLCNDLPESLRSQRVGLVSHAAAVLPDYSGAFQALRIAGVNLKALFGPEHGFAGHAEDATAVEDSRDAFSELPVYSLYGKNLEPTAEMLSDLDVLFFDMQDVGVRFYTYISTLYYVLQAAGKHSKEIIILDRPNPLGGEMRIGPLCDQHLRSFVGISSLPIQHGLTMGELALLFAEQQGCGLQPWVIKMQGWRRGMDFEQTGLPWVPTSPAMPQLSTLRLYPCTCFLEGLNLSEGRGTGLPFEICGAPWLDGAALAEALNALFLPGIRFRAHSFFPTDGKYHRQVCQGVQFHLTDPDVFEPLPSILKFIETVRDLPGSQMEFLSDSWEGKHPHFDLLMGTDLVRLRLEQRECLDDLWEIWDRDCREFAELRQEFLLYD